MSRCASSLARLQRMALFVVSLVYLLYTIFLLISLSAPFLLLPGCMAHLSIYCTLPKRHAFLLYLEFVVLWLGFYLVLHLQLVPAASIMVHCIAHTQTLSAWCSPAPRTMHTAADLPPLSGASYFETFVTVPFHSYSLLKFLHFSSTASDNWWIWSCTQRADPSSTNTDPDLTASRFRHVHTPMCNCQHTYVCACLCKHWFVKFQNWFCR